MNLQLLQQLKEMKIIKVFIKYQKMIHGKNKEQQELHLS